MNAVRILRTQLGMTQSELAAKAGTSQPTLALYEAGKKSPTLDTLGRLARAMNLELAVSFVPPLTREDQRSLAYHQAIVTKLLEAPDLVLEHARSNLKRMAAQHSGPRELFDRWALWLSLPIDELIGYCLDSSVTARDMRQVTPFSGVLSAKERAGVLKRFARERNS